MSDKSREPGRRKSLCAHLQEVNRGAPVWSPPAVVLRPHYIDAWSDQLAYNGL